MNIVTSICVNKPSDAITSDYPQLKKSRDIKMIYWRCVVTFCITARFFHPNKKIIVYTNDEDIPNLKKNYNVRKELEKLDVQINFLAFDYFDPGPYSSSFRNAFYKLEVIEQLSLLTNSSILLDSDCIWTNPNEKLFSILNDKIKLILKDTYQRNDRPHQPTPHNLSMKNMKDVYDKIKISDLSISREFPTWYGGEIIAANPDTFKIINKKLRLTFNYCIEKAKTGNLLTFNNSYSIFDGDELISSYVYNTYETDVIYDSHEIFAKRIWTAIGHNNVKSTDVNIPIWHLPASKQDGLKDLFEELIKENSIFYKLKNGHEYFLGRFFGIPNDNLSLTKRIIRYLKRAIWKMIRRKR